MEDLTRADGEVVTDFGDERRRQRPVADKPVGGVLVS
jgi:hypothetical protein